ncbi:ketopantoate reductase family protein [Pelagibaculum spongiae]|uniref:2-dehydropantoate 2-reductase n=1 Tax=Pelagibaculum spongiae TaxID=2080658 RepID=A0A2V1GTV8_9GAMM|nr:2-dehydropantoate 2-reductase [Pelagibaculum spongiae]PVZ69516.1 hypothetical protein DC094_09305 [Pelagibaculum spongiae]
MTNPSAVNSFSTTSTIHLLGAGSLGLLIACRLQQARQNISLIGRDQQAVEKFSKSGVLFENSRYLFPSFTAENIKKNSIRRLIICLKTWQTLPAIKPLINALADNAQIILIQNGMGIIEQLGDLIRQQKPEISLFHALSTHGAWKENVWKESACKNNTNQQFTVHQAGTGEIRIDANCQSSWITAFTQANLNPQTDSDIKLAAWKKLLINCCINGLTAIANCQNGQLAVNLHLKQITQQLIDECLTLSNKIYPELATQPIADLIWQVINQTAANYSSTHQDHQANRLSEIDAINGYLLDIAKTVQLSLPVNQTIYRLIKSAEAASV